MKYKAILPALVFSSLPLMGAPARCETKTLGTDTFEVCERADVLCVENVKQELKDPSSEWRGCLWSAILIKGLFKDALVYVTHVTVQPNYADSDLMDVVVTIQKPDRSFQVITQKDLPIIVQNGHAEATFSFYTPYDPLGVPTVESTEKGGAKSVKHSYK